VLDNVRVNLAVLDGPAGFERSIESNDLDLAGLTGLLNGGDGAQCRVIIDGEDGVEVGVGLQDIFGGAEGTVFQAAAGKPGDDLDAGALRASLIEHFEEAFRPLDDRLDFRMVDDGDFAVAADGFEHGLGGEAASFVVVGGNVRDHFDALCEGGNVGGEDRDARFVCLCDRGPDGFRITRSEHDGIHGWEHLDKVITIDQSPIGRSPRSNAATYTDAFSAIRTAFAAAPEARRLGLKASHFSFNVPGGRCERCEGSGTLTISMHFLPDVQVRCPVCRGQRYRSEVLEVKYGGYTIAEILDMTIEEALEVFKDVPAAASRLSVMVEVGLGYLQLGQPATTLSGGEAQRVKLAKELGRRTARSTLYLLDEPSTGLHSGDIQHLLAIFQRLVDAGSTVIVVEHNLDVIKVADWVVDLGPEGGDAGGYIVAQGTPEQVARESGSHTGRFLQSLV